MSDILRMFSVSMTFSFFQRINVPFAFCYSFRYYYEHETWNFYYFIGFITPLDDPDDGGDEDSFLPQKNSEEFRPFQRKVKEYTFWENMFITLLIGIFLTVFQAFDIPVFWPLLLFYFLLIFGLTMKKQIKHMIKYNYVPWDIGRKTTYTPKK